MIDDLEKELRFREASHLQAMESNPLNPDQIAMFKMFDREGWTPERRLEHLRRRAEETAKATIAE